MRQARLSSPRSVLQNQVFGLPTEGNSQEDTDKF